MDVFEFRNYRLYLAAEYAARKEREYGFSYRAFSRRANLGAPNYLKLVIEGQRNLSEATARRFAKALGLDEQSSGYFLDLVCFNQANTLVEKERHLRRLQTYRRYREVFHLDVAHAAYHSEWYIPAVRELISLQNFRDDPKWIAKRLCPRIAIGQARYAIDVLDKLGLVQRDKSGRLRQTEPLVEVSSSPELSHNLAVYHRAMLERASEALDRFPRTQREFGAVTLSLNSESFQRLKERLSQIREEFLQESLPSNGGQPDRVVQVNFQFFPLTNPTIGDS